MLAAMQLDYLIFDFTDEEMGCGSFDAMASVLPARLPALVGEIEAVLRWAHHEFGAPSASADEGEWDFELQGTDAADQPLEIAYDAGSGHVVFASPSGDGPATLTLTIGGSRVFCDGFRHAFDS
jgi:hypothetical protein